jgi:hypothetical protein
MHCPRCGNNATVGQQFCRSCGFNLEKIAELLGEQLASDRSSGNEIARLRERQRKLERWGGIAGLSTFGVILIMLIVVVFQQMILRGGAIVVPGVLLILLAIGAAAMGVFQTFSKSLKEKLTNPPLPRSPERPETAEAPKLEPYLGPVSSVTDGTTELLTTASGADTGKIDD